jgi:LEA14-like dessication related protein
MQCITKSKAVILVCTRAYSSLSYIKFDVKNASHQCFFAHASLYRAMKLPKPLCALKKFLYCFKVKFAYIYINESLVLTQFSMKNYNVVVYSENWTVQNIWGFSVVKWFSGFFLWKNWKFSILLIEHDKTTPRTVF